MYSIWKFFHSLFIDKAYVNLEFVQRKTFPCNSFKNILSGNVKGEKGRSFLTGHFYHNKYYELV